MPTFHITFLHPHEEDTAFDAHGLRTLQKRFDDLEDKKIITLMSDLHDLPLAILLELFTGSPIAFQIDSIANGGN